MCKVQFILGLVAWYVRVTHSWDFAVSLGDQVIFYTADGTKTDTIHFESQNVTRIAYDEVHNRMLYVDKHSDNDAICGYYISSNENKCFLEGSGRNIHSIAYDPATEKIFFTDTNEKSINWISLKRGSNANVNSLIKTADWTTDIAVDSCRGYIYWSHGNNIERVRLNGSGREAELYKYGLSFEVFNLAINTQTIFYIDGCGYTANYINRADLDGLNERVLDVDIKTQGKEMTVSKHYIYWLNSSRSYDSVWQYPKHGGYGVKPKEIRKFYTNSTLGLAANYKIEDQTSGVLDCDSLSSLLPITEAPATTQRSVPVCENYCLQGTCSVNDEGLPKCSCNAGHTGLRCEVSVYLGYCASNGDCTLNGNSEPVCLCKGDYSGERCEISDCMNYCMHGNCSLTDDGHPTCSCDVGYSGERCEVSACHGYCLNDGECSINEEDEPVCQCVGDHEGTRCEADINNTTPTYDLTKRNLTLADLLSTWRNTSSMIYLTVNNFINSSVTMQQNGLNAMGPPA